jgi:hypothetical protein
MDELLGERGETAAASVVVVLHEEPLLPMAVSFMKGLRRCRGGRIRRRRGACRRSTRRRGASSPSLSPVASGFLEHACMPRDAHQLQIRFSR